MGAELNFAGELLPLLGPGAIHGLLLFGCLWLRNRSGMLVRPAIVVMATGVPAAAISLICAVAFEQRQQYLIELGCFP